MAAERAKERGVPFAEVFINAPLAECERRDPKQLYKKARSGEIKQFTGIDSPYEAPLAPDLEIRTDRLSVNDSIEKLTQLALGLARPLEQAGAGAASTYEPGTVYLVGAGPGDPELITLKGRRVLGEADAVVYDHLVDAELLELTPPDCEPDLRGKEGRPGLRPQNEIDETLVRLALEGKTVVRLKGGDPVHLRPGRRGGLGARRGRHPL